MFDLCRKEKGRPRPPIATAGRGSERALARCIKWARPVPLRWARKKKRAAKTAQDLDAPLMSTKRLMGGCRSSRDATTRPRSTARPGHAEEADRGRRRPRARLASPRYRRQCLASPTRAVGRRQQRRGARAGRGGRVRPEHAYEHIAAKGGDRGDHGARVGARSRTRRRALHDVPDLTRPGLSESTRRETIMSFNLRNRSLLMVQDYTPREFRYLLDLARDFKRAKYARTEQKHLSGKEICLISRRHRPARAARSRSPATTRART